MNYNKYPPSDENIGYEQYSSGNTIGLKTADLHLYFYFLQMYIQCIRKKPIDIM